MAPTRWKVTGRLDGQPKTVYVNARSAEQAARVAADSYALRDIESVTPDESKSGPLAALRPLVPNAAATTEEES